MTEWIQVVLTVFAANTKQGLKKPIQMSRKMTNHPTEKWIKDMNRQVKGKYLILKEKRCSNPPPEELMNSYLS